MSLLDGIINMQDFTHHSGSTTDSKTAWRLWLTIFVLGGVFFFVDHDLGISRYPQFAPWANSDEIIASGGNALKGAALSLIGLLGLYFLMDKEGRKLQLRGIAPALMFFFVAWAAISITWSIDPPLTLRRVAVLCFYFLGALGIARKLSDRDLAVAALVVTAAYLAVGVAAELALGTFRPWAADYRFSGTLHPNYQGLHMMILCLAAFLLARNNPCAGRRKWLTILFVVGFVFLILTKSRTSLAGFMLAMSVIWFLQTSSFNRIVSLAGITFSICATLLICSILGFNEKDVLSNALMLGRQDNSEQLTGRMPIWTELMHYVDRRPLTGYGYESFWTAENIEDLSETLQWRFRQAHSGYIDAVLSAGLIGSSCLLLIVFTGIFNAAKQFRKNNNIYYCLTLGLLIFGLVDAFLESGMIGENFVTLLAGCGIIQLACLKSERNLHEAIESALDNDSYSSSSMTVNPRSCQTHGLQTMGLD
jgi:exopolysaccharide production protein ExoQ